MPSPPARCRWPTDSAASWSATSSVTFPSPHSFGSLCRLRLDIRAMGADEFEAGFVDGASQAVDERLARAFRLALPDLRELLFALRDIGIDHRRYTLGRQQMRKKHRENEGRAVPVFRQGFHQRTQEHRTSRGRDRIDLPVGPLLLAFGAHRDQTLLGQPVQRRIDRAETRLHEVLVPVVLEGLFDLVSRGVAAGQDPETDRANVHGVLYWFDIDRAYIGSVTK